MCSAEAGGHTSGLRKVRKESGGPERTAGKAQAHRDHVHRTLEPLEHPYRRTEQGKAPHYAQAPWPCQGTQSRVGLPRGLHVLWVGCYYL